MGYTHTRSLQDHALQCCTLIISCTGCTSPFSPPTPPPSLLPKLLIWNMLMRSVSIADSLWTFYFVTTDSNGGGSEQEGFCRKPSALLPPSAGPHFIWIINDSPFFSPPPSPQPHRRFSSSSVLAVRGKERQREGHQPWRRIVVSDCKATAKGLEATAARRGRARTLYTATPNRDVFIGASHRAIVILPLFWVTGHEMKSPGILFFLQEQKENEKYFPAATMKVIPSSKTRPRRDFYHCGTHIGLHSCCWCQTDKKKKKSPRIKSFNQRYMRIYKWITLGRGHKTLPSSSCRALTPPTQISFLTVNLHTFQADMCSSKSNSNISRAWRHTTVLQTAIKPLASALWCALHFTTPILCVETGTCAQ